MPEPTANFGAFLRRVPTWAWLIVAGLVIAAVLYFALSGGGKYVIAFTSIDERGAPLVAHELLSRGKPTIMGDVVVYTDWNTGATMTMRGRNFMIRRVPDNYPR